MDNQTTPPGAADMKEKTDVPAKFAMSHSMTLQVQQRIREGGFASEAEYYRALVRADLEQWARWKLSAPPMPGGRAA